MRLHKGHPIAGGHCHRAANHEHLGTTARNELDDSILDHHDNICTPDDHHDVHETAAGACRTAGRSTGIRT